MTGGGKADDSGGRPGFFGGLEEQRLDQLKEKKMGEVVGADLKLESILRRHSGPIANHSPTGSADIPLSSKRDMPSRQHWLRPSLAVRQHTRARALLQVRTDQDIQLAARLGLEVFHTFLHTFERIQMHLNRDWPWSGLVLGFGHDIVNHLLELWHVPCGKE